MNPTITDQRKRAQIKLVNAARYYPDKLEQARSDYKALRIAEIVERELAKAPPLSKDQLAVIAQVFATAQGGN